MRACGHFLYSATAALIATVVTESRRPSVARTPMLFTGAALLDGLEPAAGDDTTLLLPEITVPVLEDDEPLVVIDELFSPLLDFLPLHTGWIEEHCIVAFTIKSRTTRQQQRY